MNIQDIAHDIEIHRKVKDPFGWEFSLYCMVVNLKSMEFDSVCALANHLADEYSGHIEAGDHLLITVLEVIDGHIALRLINP